MYNYTESRNLREQRTAVHSQAVAILAKKNITQEDRSRFDKIMADVAGFTARINQIENTSGAPTETDFKRSMAFSRFIRHGKTVLDATEQRMLETRDGVVEGAPMLTHVGTYSGLGFLVPTGFRAEIEQATKYFCPLSDPSVSGCQVITTDSGNPLPMPISNDTTQVATIVGESAQVNEDDITASHIIFAAYKFTSGVVKASIELLQDSGIDVDAWLAKRFGERYGRALEAYLTTGTGSGQPTGLLTAIEACGVSPVIAAGSSNNDGGSGTGANSIGSQDLVALEHGVDPSYRRGARYMFNDNTLATLQKLLDKFGRPLWQPSVTVGAPAMINGYPYIINQAMPSIAAGANTVIFGDFSKYVIRKVKDLSVQRLEELYATTGQVGFVSFARIDANLLDAGTHPLNILEMHS